jgi:hypothetical protein
MLRKRILIFGSTAVVVSCLSFAAGWRNPARNQLSPNSIETINSASSGSLSVKTHQPEPIDVTNARITNVGSLGFEEVFDLLSNANAEFRQKWARQLEDMPFGPEKFAAVSSFYRTLVQVDAAAAAKLIVESQDPATREIAIRYVLPAVPSADIREIAKMLDQLPDEERRGHISQVIRSWSEIDPVSAAQYFEQHENDISTYDPCQLLRNWASLDPVAAKAWLDGHQFDNEKMPQAIRGYAQGLMENDRAGAFDFLVAHANEPNFGIAIISAANSTFEKSPDEARQFVLRLSNPAVQQIALENIAGLTGSFWFREWQKSPGTLAKWFVALPPPLWADHIGPLEKQWEDTNPADFRAWLDQLQTEQRDLAVARYCHERNSSDPDQWSKALLLGRSITDVGLRDKALQEMVEGSALTREELSTILQQSNMPAAEASRLIALIPVPDE